MQPGVDGQTLAKKYVLFPLANGRGIRSNAHKAPHIPSTELREERERISLQKKAGATIAFDAQY